MSVYTKTGDKGKTSLYSGKRVLKSHSQIKALGAVDELSSFIGLVINKLKNEKEKLFLTKTQKNLYLAMALLAGKKKGKTELESELKKVEQYIDNIAKDLPKLNRFILSQKTELSGWFNVLRTICRRAEREVVGSFNEKKIEIEDWESEIIKFLNRLSDWFFIMARKYSENKEILA